MAERRGDPAKLTPGARAALVAELSACAARAALAPDEAAVLGHLFGAAGFTEDGLFVPVLAALWGAEASYVPPVPLPPERVRAAVTSLRRRGVLVGVHGGVALSSEGLRALAAAAASAAPPASAKKRRPRRRARG